MNTKKVALVTGGKRGIGLAIVKKLISDGYFCIVADVLNKEEELIKDTEYIRCDISESKDRENLCGHIETVHKRLDLLVNNAGVPCKTRDDILIASEESFDGAVTKASQKSRLKRKVLSGFLLYKSTNHLKEGAFSYTLFAFYVKKWYNIYDKFN